MGGAGFFSALVPASASSAGNGFFADIGSGVVDQYSVYVLICSVFLILLLLLTLQNIRKIEIWKVLLVVVITESLIMLGLKTLLPSDTSIFVETLLDAGLLALFISPVAWRLKRTAAELLDRKTDLEKNLEAQQIINQLLFLPIHELDLETFMDRVLNIIYTISWLKVLPKGALYLNDGRQQILRMVAQKNLSLEIRESCAQIKHGQCLCGMAASRRNIQFHSHVDDEHVISYEGMHDHGHFIVPLLVENELYGVLCLYLLPGHQVQQIEMETLNLLGVTLAELIRLKQALEEIDLAKNVFEHNLNCMMVTDASKKILNVNPVFSEVTGYSSDEVIGKSPNFLKSSKQGHVFYRELWKSLLKNNRWEGEIWTQRKDGEAFPVWLSVTGILGKNGLIQNYVFAFADISVRKAAEQRIHQLAYFDSLTGLANRTLFYDRLQQAIKQARRNNTKVALLFIDLDRFKEVNDTLGHQAGDELLKTVAGRISSCLRETDTLARLGGDEFVVILRELKESGFFNPSMVCQKVAETILHKLAKVHHYEGHDFYGGASIGIILYPDNADNISDLLQRADTAMYEAKNAGRNTYRFFSHQMAEVIKSRVTMEHELRTAIEAGEFSLLYQPLIEMDHQTIIGAEALLRWHNGLLGEVPPSDFIPLAEETGLIYDIGIWVMEQVCRQIQQWDAENANSLQYIALNVSIHQIIRKEFTGQAVSLCNKAGVKINRLELEITEGGLAQYPENIAEVLHQLREVGFRLAIDDFGTDYSSLSRLKSFNVDLLKIDRSFVLEMCTDTDDAAIVKAIVDLGDALGLTTLAEGVESMEQFNLLKKMGCHRCQGYYFGKPMPASELAELYLQQQSSGRR